MSVFVTQSLQQFLKDEGLTALLALASEDVLQKAREALNRPGLLPVVKNNLADLIQVAEVRRSNGT